MVKGIINFFRSRFSWKCRAYPLRKFKKILWINSGTNFPFNLRKGVLVFIGPKEKPKWAKFICPCGCGELMALNLMTSHHPHWIIEINKDDKVTAYPSVDATICGSHYWIKKNEILWV